MLETDESGACCDLPFLLPTPIAVHRAFPLTSVLNPSTIIPRGRRTHPTPRRSGRSSTIASTLAAAGGGVPATTNTRGRGAGRGRGADRGRRAGADRGRGASRGLAGRAVAATVPQASTSSTPLESDQDSEDLETDSDYLLGLVREAVQQILAESGQVAGSTSTNPPSSGTF